MYRRYATCDSTYLLIYFFNKHLLKTHCIPGTLLSIKKLTLNVTKPGGASGKESGEDVRDSGSIPGLGSSPGGGRGNPFQYSCLESPMDREAWQAAVHAVAKHQTWLNRLSTHACMNNYMSRNLTT